MINKGLGWKGIKIGIIGAGPAGLFCAQRLLDSGIDKEDIVLIDKGKRITSRACPGRFNCLRCDVCDITCGFGGAGGFSDGKLIYSISTGGNLWELGRNDIPLCMAEVEEITKRIEPTLRDAFKNSYQNTEGKLVHLGSDGCEWFMEALYKQMKEDGPLLWLNTKVNSVNGTTIRTEPVHTKEDEKAATGRMMQNIDCDYVVIAVGREGNSKIEKLAQTLPSKGAVDIGVRVELPYLCAAHLTDRQYEFKLRTEAFGLELRTFCVNPHGYVLHQHSNGVTTVNGYAYRRRRHSNLTNFAILAKVPFSQIQDPSGYATHQSHGCRTLNGKDIITQRVVDFLLDRATPDEEMHNVHLSYKGSPGNLNMIFPYRIAKALHEGIKVFAKDIPGLYSEDAWLHGIETKLYSNRVPVTRVFETPIDNVFCIGDGSGWTRGFMQAACSGIMVADEICLRIEREG